VALLAESKSILTGDLWDYLDSFAARQTRSQRLFQYVARQQIKLNPPTIMPLTAGKAAHQFLESGKSTGKILLQPESK
jgi:NADPH2:quinone reductase